MSTSTYMGAYIVIPKQKKEVVVKEWRCLVCDTLKDKKDTFCSKCGSEIVASETPVMEECTADSFWYHVATAYKIEEEDAFTSFDPHNYVDYDGFIYYPNIPTEHSEFISFNIDDDGVYPIPSQTQIESAKAYLFLDFAKEIECLREVVGDNVRIKYGILKYVW